MDQSTTKLLAQIRRECTFVRCFFAMLAALVAVTVAAFLKWVDFWSAVPIFLVVMGMLLAFLAGAVSTSPRMLRPPRPRFPHHA
jgi:hypothetical protein